MHYSTEIYLYPFITILQSRDELPAWWQSVYCLHMVFHLLLINTNIILISVEFIIICKNICKNLSVDARKTQTTQNTYMKLNIVIVLSIFAVVTDKIC